MSLLARITPRDVRDDILRDKLNALIDSVNLSDLNLEIPAGNVTGRTSVNKFGRSTNVDNGVDTDIWDRANATQDQDIWTAPTVARTHQIVSTDAGDDGNPVGVGARTLRVYGLTSWTAKEVSEDITLNGITNVPTVNSYVIIHRMQVLTKGATNINVGLITATADTDGTVTAQINAGEGQTQMAIYGIPTVQKAYMTSFYASTLKAVATADIDLTLLFNPEPNSELTNFLTKSTLSMENAGTTFVQRQFSPYLRLDGPGIVKMQAVSGADNADVSAGFDLVLVDN